MSPPEHAGKHPVAAEHGRLSYAPDIDAPTVDRRHPLPLYHQLRVVLLRMIEHEGLEPGDRLPTGPELEARYGVSRATIRKALDDLASEGVVETIQGRGTFVAPRRFRHVASLTSFAEDMSRQGRVPSRQVLVSTRMGATPLVADNLGIEVGEECSYLQRLLSADGQRIGLGDTWIPVAALGGHDNVLDDLGEGSLYALLKSPPLSLRLTQGTEVLRGGAAEEEHSRLLGCPEGSPMLVIERWAEVEGGRVVEWTRTAFPADRYEYRVDISAP